jgi:hypothetical protein
VPPPIAEVTARAQTLTSAGDLAGARDVLAPALDPSDTDPQRATPDLAVAAALHARILIALGEAHAALTWAGFAHAAEERLHGSHDDRTLAAAATHAAVLARVGNHGRAAQLYHDLVLELTAREGRESPRVLAAEADLATAEHAAGHCTAARSRLGEAWARHRRVYGDPSPAGLKMLARLGAMERACGRHADAGQHLALAQELCARYLPDDHPLVAQIARLAAAPASGEHRCGGVRRSTGPDEDAPGVTPVGPRHAAAPPASGRGAEAAGPEAAATRATVGGSAGGAGTGGAAATGRRAAGDATATGRRAAGDATAAGSRAASDATAAGSRAAGDGGRAGGGVADAAGPSVTDDAAADPPPDDRATDPNGAVYQQPLYLRDLHQPPGDPTGRHARADTPPPMPGPRLPEYTPDGRRVPIGSAPVGDPDPPLAADPRLPVLVEHAEPSSRRPFVLTAALVAGIGVAAAIVAATLARGEPAAPPPATASAAPPAAAPASPGSSGPASGNSASGNSASGPAASGPAATGPAAPAEVRLRDNRDSVTLTWRYPKGSEGPVLISGGRSGEPQRAFQQLPAGSADYVVYGLNEGLNYCFTVAVVHGTDKVATSPAVCTARG